jgi:hypothetical protein
VNGRKGGLDIMKNESSFGPVRASWRRNFAGRGMIFALVPVFASAAVMAASCAAPEEGTIVLGDAPEAAAPSVPLLPSPTTGDASIDGEPASTFEPEKVLGCIGTTCPAPYATCPSATGKGEYTCGVNLLTDSNNCGACGNVCPGATVFGTLRMTTQCVDGKCQRECANPTTSYDFRDCNGRVDDGCEVDAKSDLENCGTCGNKCPEGTDRCVDGQCGCPGGMTYCGCPLGLPVCGTRACKDTSSDNDNCGGCGNKCSAPDAGPLPPNMEYGCVASQCGQPRCKSGWADCDGTTDPNGCETNVAADPNNCGGCGKKCGPDQVCIVPSSGTPTCACAKGETLCSSTREGLFCTDLLMDASNCGVCGYACPGSTLPSSHGFPKCGQGFCSYECEEGWGDCDSNPSNGCETNLMVNTGNCGACGNRCDTSAGQPCIDGKCLMVECDGGLVVTK